MLLVVCSFHLRNAVCECRGDASNTVRVKWISYASEVPSVRSVPSGTTAVPAVLFPQAPALSRRLRSASAQRDVPHGAAHVETQHSSASEGGSYSATVSQGYVLPEGKIMPNTVFVGGIDIRMNEAEIRSVFEQYGTVKEVKVITDRTGVSKGYGFVSFLDNVDVQKIVESQINFHGKKLKLGPAIRKQQNLNSSVQPRQLVLGPPAPQFQSVWSSQTVETYVQPPAVVNPVTPYVQPYPYNSSPAVLVKPQVPVGYQPAYNYQAQPQWLPGEPRNYVMPPPTPMYTSVNCHGTEDPGLLQLECAVPEPTQLPSSPQKKSVDRGMQTVLSCLSNPENQLTNDFVAQENNVKESKTYHFRKGKTVHKSV
ncbi:PREDICTED: deleted in azoospermia-like [Sturnus vulgaris]|uniref:deleted in azoospermia-like n=1 Tax=Sturnus vulgaris TaxID=9172 RepID=UPI00071A1FA2|nr:PREDICTED: deleted in azoospermia-like [Sturnus vulgaris]